uniref:Secreted protein n=1 Tax=Plectus sambesii TaxID=2011161 RepID=A0A914V3L0_9BILA
MPISTSNVILLCTAISFAVGQDVQQWRTGEVESIYHVVVRPPGLIARNLTLGGRTRNNGTAGVKFPPPRSYANTSDTESDEDKRSIFVNRQRISKFCLALG